MNDPELLHRLDVLERLIREMMARNATMPDNDWITAEDFAKWEAQAKTMTTACLLYTVRDCQKAEAAMRGWNPIKEGFYSDQASTFGMELTRRRRA